MNFIVDLRSETGGDEEHGGAEWVADVEQFGLAGGFEDVVDAGRNVKVAQVVPGEVPELFIIGIQVDVSSGVSVAACVAQPHVVAAVSQ